MPAWMTVFLMTCSVCVASRRINSGIDFDHCEMSQQKKQKDLVVVTVHITIYHVIYTVLTTASNTEEMWSFG